MPLTFNHGQNQLLPLLRQLIPYICRPVYRGTLIRFSWSRSRMDTTKVSGTLDPRSIRGGTTKKIIF